MDPLVGTGLAAPSPAAVRADVGRNGDREARVKAARELATTFVTELMGAMRRTIPDAGLTDKSAERSVLEGVFDRTLAEAVTAHDGLGLERQIAGQVGGIPRPGVGYPTPSIAPLKNPTGPADTSGENPLPSQGSGRRD